MLSRKRFQSLARVALLLAWAGCAEQANDPAEFEEGVGDLQSDFGDGKEDLFGAALDPCSLLRPLKPFGHDAERAGFFVGMEGEATVGIANTFGGYDIVFDLYHQQVSVSQYRGAGISTPEVSTSAGAYVGVAFGFEHGVSDWDGYFVNGNVNASLPFLKDFASVEIGGFVTGQDRNGDHVIAPSEVLLPPNGVYGGSIGISVGLTPVPTPSPVDGNITEGFWWPQKNAIRAVYDRLLTRRIAGIRHVKARLVDAENGSLCPADWPRVQTEKDCIIELGDPSSSRTRRAVDFAYGLCSESTGCKTPLSWPLAMTAVAVGALRDSGTSIDNMCN
jgi:hypothetical protein